MYTHFVQACYIIQYIIVDYKIESDAVYHYYSRIVMINYKLF
jgi:hypothetical protein